MSYLPYLCLRIVSMNYNNLPLVVLLFITSSLLNSQFIIWTGPVKHRCLPFVKMTIGVIFYGVISPATEQCRRILILKTGLNFMI